MTQRKLNVQGVRDWGHHRAGWPHCVQAMHESCHTDDGVLMFPNTVIPEMLEGDKVVTEPWVGVLHQSPSCVRQLRPTAAWEENMKSCRGVFLLNKAAASEFRQRFPRVRVNAIHYGLSDFGIPFQEHALDRKRATVLFIGHWLRDLSVFQQMYLNERRFQKRLLCGVDHGQAPGRNTIKMSHVPNSIYDALLARSIVFLQLHDAGSNTTVLECLARNTPLVINRLPAVEEYLGRDYPLFFNDRGVAYSMINDVRRLRAGHEYLKTQDKTHITLDNFVRELTESEIYDQL